MEKSRTNMVFGSGLQKEISIRMYFAYFTYYVSHFSLNFYHRLPSISHLSPINRSGHLHSNASPTFVHLAPLKHGRLAHGLAVARGLRRIIFIFLPDTSIELAYVYVAESNLAL